MTVELWDYAYTFHTCPSCDGRGEVMRETCGICDGCGDVQWPSHVRADSGQVYAFAGVDSLSYGMYGGLAGFAFTLSEARACAYVPGVSA